MEEVDRSDEHPAHAEYPEAVVPIHLDDQRLVRRQPPDHVRGHAARVWHLRQLLAEAPGKLLSWRGSQTPPDVIHECSGQSVIAPSRNLPAQSIASIIRSAPGRGRGSAMPIRSMVSVVGLSPQASKASRMNSLRLPGVSGSQLAARASPPMNSSKLPAASASIWLPRMLHSGMSPNGSCSGGKVGAGDAIGPRSLHGQVEPARGALAAGDPIGVFARNPCLAIGEVRDIAAQLHRLAW
jgi:hypothetical protein